MAGNKPLPADYALDALREEVLRRQKITGDITYSYGRLICDLQPGERERILKRYRRNYYRRNKAAPLRLEDYDNDEEIQRFLAEIAEEE